jgi:signal transduction histidine kinase
MRTEVEAIDDFYQNYVPAVHQAVLVLSACLEIYYIENSLVQNYSNTLLQERIVVIGNLVIAVLIVFIEGRIKHNDTQRILLRELMSTKKSYVRWLSHELRTPLNTTFLGITLLSDAVASSKDAKDAETFQILGGMKTACKSAVDILNDLIVRNFVLVLHVDTSYISHDFFFVFHVDT